VANLIAAAAVSIGFANYLRHFILLEESETLTFEH